MLEVELGRITRGLFAGGSTIVGSVVVDALGFWLSLISETLDAFEIESRILWNFRLVVVSAAGILKNKGKQG